MKVDGQLAFQAMVRNKGTAPTPEMIARMLETGGEVMISDDELKQRISDFFRDHTETIVDPEEGTEMMVWRKPPTKAGFASSIGLELRTLQRYLNDSYSEQYSGTGSTARVSKAGIQHIRNAMQIISGFYEERLSTQSPVGSIFWLKNFQTGTWKDDAALRADVETQTLQIGKPTVSAAEIAARHAGATMPEMPDFD